MTKACCAIFSVKSSAFKPGSLTWHSPPWSPAGRYRGGRAGHLRRHHLRPSRRPLRLAGCSNGCDLKVFAASAGAAAPCAED